MPSAYPVITIDLTRCRKGQLSKRFINTVKALVLTINFVKIVHYLLVHDFEVWTHDVQLVVLEALLTAILRTCARFWRHM